MFSLRGAGVFMRSFLTEPLVHFLIIGFLLFIGFEALKDTSAGNGDTVTITRSAIKTIQANFLRTWSREPTAQELDKLIEELVRDEIAQREAEAMGLDQDDLYIRKRLRMKFELLLDDFTSGSKPDDTELQQYLDNNREKFNIPPRYALQQIYFNPELRKGTIAADMEDALKKLNKADTDSKVELLGDSTMLPLSVPAMTPRMISRQFGSEFTAQIEALPLGQWSTPLRSGYGYHLVMITDKIESRTVQLDEVREQVEREWTAARKKEVKEQAYERLRSKYQVIIESEASEQAASEDTSR